jgi:hypothetical protein
MRVVDTYGFDADLVDKLEPIHHDQEQLREPDPTRRAMRAIHELRGTVTKTAEELELESSIRDKQAALACPSSYRELDSRQDRARLKEIEAESTRRPLTTAEQKEQGHLQARREVYSWTPEAADCNKMNLLKDLGANLRTPEEERELERLKTRYGDIPLDSTLVERRGTWREFVSRQRKR